MKYDTRYYDCYKAAIHEFLRELSVIYTTIQQQQDCFVVLDFRNSTAPLNVMKRPVENTSDKWNFLLSQMFLTPTEAIWE